MKLLVNDKEIANFLLDQIDYREQLKHIEFTKYNLADLVMDFNEKRKKSPNKRLTDIFKKKFRDRLIKANTKDVKNYIDRIKLELENARNRDFEKMHKGVEHLIDVLGIENIFENYEKVDTTGFIKGVGKHIAPNGKFMRRKEFNDYTGDALIRNTVGNEELLVTKIDNNYPMWFIDSGYTNFLEPNKKWHRLVRNHLHYGDYFDAPVDRLSNFKEFPKQWRDEGEYIYVIEPGPFAASIFHADLKTWKYDVEAELRQYTDKKIRFREKKPLRERTRLYDELLNEDYHCIVSINSNAATEAIWAGIPAITLGKHITNPVTVNKLSDVNNLYRGNLANWLAMLSYSQFTKKELLDGTAVKLVKKYNNV